MSAVKEKINHLCKRAKEVVIDYLEDNDVDIENDWKYVLSYIVGVFAGYLEKWMTEWPVSNHWFTRAFNRYLEAEPLRLTSDKWGVKVERIPQFIVSYNLDGDISPKGMLQFKPKPALIIRQ